MKTALRQARQRFLDSRWTAVTLIRLPSRERKSAQFSESTFLLRSGKGVVDRLAAGGSVDKALLSDGILQRTHGFRTTTGQSHAKSWCRRRRVSSSSRIAVSAV